ncbi:hypothetical protein ACWGAD_27580, partial [Streptomyces sp. NPDC055058]
ADPAVADASPSRRDRASHHPGAQLPPPPHPPPPPQDDPPPQDEPLPPQDDPAEPPPPSPDAHQLSRRRLDAGPARPAPRDVALLNTTTAPMIANVTMTQ